MFSTPLPLTARSRSTESDRALYISASSPEIRPPLACVIRSSPAASMSLGLTPSRSSRTRISRAYFGYCSRYPWVVTSASTGVARSRESPSACAMSSPVAELGSCDTMMSTPGASAIACDTSCRLLAGGSTVNPRARN